MRISKKVCPSSMEELIFKYLAKELTPEESKQLKSWLEHDRLNRVLFNKLTAYYKNDESKLPVMKELVWNDVNQKVGISHPKTRSLDSPFLKNLLKVAAVFLIVSATIFVIYNSPQGIKDQQGIAIKTITKEAPLGSKVTTKLPDGSLVMLNSGSSVSFPEEFVGDSREVLLSGEAFFDVKHNKDKPFLVQMSGDVVRVLGTSFNIRSYLEDSAVYVSVATGRVSYSVPSGDEVILEPNRMATYVPHKRTLTTGEVDEIQAFGWKNKILDFDDMTFDKVVVEIERWYGVNINYTGSIDLSGTYSERFSNPTLFEVLHSLSFVYRFDFKIEGKNISIEKITT